MVFFGTVEKKKGVYEYINIIGFDLELLRKKRELGGLEKRKKRKHRKKKEKRKKEIKEKK